MRHEAGQFSRRHGNDKLGKIVTFRFAVGNHLVTYPRNSKNQRFFVFNKQKLIRNECTSELNPTKILCPNDIVKEKVCMTKKSCDVFNFCVIN